MATAESPPRISVIIPAYRSWETLPRVMEALAPQVQRTGREAIVVDSSADGRAAELAGRFPWAQVIALERRALPGRARNLGAAAAQGELLAYLDADAVPSPTWLDALEAALGDATQADAVTSPVRNGTPWHPVGTAGYLLEFAEWLPGRTGPPGHAPTCSLLISRSAVDAAGGFAEEIFPGEDTILTYPIARRGRLGFATRAHVTHLNRTSLRAFLTHQVRLGACFVALCDRAGFPHAWVTRLWGIPCGAALRLAALALNVRRSPREGLQLLLFLPLVVLGLTFWTLGVLAARLGICRPRR